MVIGVGRKGEDEVIRKAKTQEKGVNRRWMEGIEEVLFP